MRDEARSRYLCFFGQIASRLNLVKVDQIPTCGTDGRRFYYQDDFVNSLSEDEMMFVFAHETWHCILEHVAFPAATEFRKYKSRQGDRDHKLWNIAADLLINGDLVQMNIGKMPDCGIYDSRFNSQNWTTEQIYEKIKQEEDSGQKQWSNKTTLDVHISPDGSCDDEQLQEEIKNKCPGISNEEANGLAEDIKYAVKESAKNANLKNAGASGSPLLDRTIKELTEGKVDWRDYLIAAIVRCFDTYNFTYAEYNRFNAGLAGAVMPVEEEEGEQIDVTIAMDTSGSISQNELKTFLSEVHGLIAQYNNYKVHIMSFDTKVMNHQEYTEENHTGIMDYEPQGGGGTDFMCVYEYLKHKEIVPEQLIIMTDGMPCGDWGDPDYCPALFLMKHPEAPQPPFGTRIIVDEFS